MTAAFLDIRTAAARPVTLAKAPRDMTRLFGLDRLQAEGRSLACRWHRDADGRLACRWEPDGRSRAFPAPDAL